MKLILLVTAVFVVCSCIPASWTGESKSEALKIMFELRKKNDIGAYLDGLNTSNTFLQKLILKELKSKNSPDVVPALIGCFNKTDDLSLQADIVKTISELDFSSHNDFFIKNLEHHSSTVKSLCLDLLTKYSRSDVSDHVLGKLYDADFNTRLSACRSVGELQIVKAVPRLIELLYDENRNVVSSSYNTIISFEDKAIPYLKKTITERMLNEKHARQILSAYYVYYYKDTITLCLDLMGEIQSPTGIEFLMPLLEHSFPPYRIVTEDALRSIFKSNIFAVLDILSNEVDEGVIIKLLDIIDGFNLSPSIKLFNKLLYKSTAKVKLKALSILGTTSPDWSYNILFDAYRCGKGDEKMYALRGLSLFGQKDRRKELTSIYENVIKSNNQRLIYYALVGLLNLKDNKHLDILKKLYSVCDSKCKEIIILCLQHYDNKEIVNVLRDMLLNEKGRPLLFAIALVRHKEVREVSDILRNLLKYTADDRLKCELKSTLTIIASDSFKLDDNCNPLQIQFIAPNRNVF